MLLQQHLGLQDEEERSLNSLDDLHASASRSRSEGNPRDRDRQLLQDLVSFYLSAPSSSSSSSPVQTLSRHNGGMGFPSSSSSSSFLPNLDFPLDYGEDYVSQVTQLHKQQKQAQKKKMQDYESLSGLDGERRSPRGRARFIIHLKTKVAPRHVLLCLPDGSLQRLELLLHHLDLDPSPGQKNKLQLQGSYKQSKGLCPNGKVFTELTTEISKVLILF